MRRRARYRSRARLLLGAVVTVASVLPAAAQVSGGQPGGLHMQGGSHGSGSARQTTPAPTPLKVQPDPWPRLDPGAMLCKSEDALKQYQTALDAATPDAPATIPVDCARVLERTPISIVQRDGPGREEVRSSSPPVRDGWTNVWLPDKPP